MTAAAEQFVSAVTFATLARHQAYTDAAFWLPTSGRPLHIDLGEWAEAILIAPLSANTLGKLALGLADNLLTNVLLASSAPVLLAPAMNTQMWQATAVQRNWDQLRLDPRYWSISPTQGRLACDTVGPGRMAEPNHLEAALLAMIWTQGKRDWHGKRVLVSAGGTREAIDPARFIGNPASGRMGVALASAAADRGAEVILVHGPLLDGLSSSDHDSSGIQRVPVTSATEMHQALLHHFPSTDFTLMAAAVSDVRPITPSPTKLPKADLPLTLDLEWVPDILQDLSQHKRPDQKLIGFAAQTGDLIPPALAKLKAKGLDAIVANPIDQPHRGFGSVWNEAIWIPHQGEQVTIPQCSKQIMAHKILDLGIRL